MGRKNLNRTDREKLQGRWFECIMYDSEATPERLNRLSAGYWDEFYYIRHDRDLISQLEADSWCIDHDIHCDSNITNNDVDGKPVVGSIKKPHYHIVAYVKNPCILARAAIKFDIPSNRVQRVEKSKSAIRYLLHLDQPEKTSYRLEEIITNNSSALSRYCAGDGLSVDDKARIIIEKLEQCYNFTMSQICMEMIHNGVYDEFRRGQHLYTAIIYELREQGKSKRRKENFEK